MNVMAKFQEFRRSRPAAALIMALAFTAGCSSVIQGRREPGVPASVAERDAGFVIPFESYAAVGYRLDWRGYPTIHPGERVTRLAAYPDALVVHESGNALTVMESANGGVRWSTALASRLTRFVGLGRVNDPRHGDTITVASDSEVFLLSAATGTLVSRQAFGQVVNVGPLTVGSSGIFGSPAGELLCHQYANGIRFWTVGASGSYEQSPVRVGDAVGAVTNTGRVSFIDPMSGRLLGGGRIFSGPGAPLTGNDYAMYVASLDQSLYGYLPTGDVLWRHRTSAPLRQAPTATADAVYCTTDGSLRAFDAYSGQVIWTAQGVAGTVLGRRQSNLLVWDGTTMALVDAARGDVIAREILPGVRLITMSAFDDGDMYVVSVSGVVAKFVTR